MVCLSGTSRLLVCSVCLSPRVSHKRTEATPESPKGPSVSNNLDHQYCLFGCLFVCQTLLCDRSDAEGFVYLSRTTSITSNDASVVLGLCRWDCQNRIQCTLVVVTAWTPAVKKQIYGFPHHGTITPCWCRILRSRALTNEIWSHCQVLPSISVCL